MPAFVKFVFALVLLPRAILAEEVVTVNLLPQANVEGGMIRLGQIAEISGPRYFAAKLETLSVGPAAGFGLSRWIDGENVALHILDRYPGQVLIPNSKIRIAVATAADTLPLDSVSARVEEFLSQQPVSVGGRWHFAWSKQPPALAVPKMPYALKVAFSGRRHRGKVALDLAVVAHDKILRTYQLLTDFMIEEPVRVATRLILRGEILAENNTRMELRETTRFEPEGLPDAIKVLGMQARQSIPTDCILTQNLVAWPPVVRRGEGAKLVVRTGSIRIATEVVCRQDGVPGQIISARHPETHRLLRARVLQNGELEPVLEGGT